MPPPTRDVPIPALDQAASPPPVLRDLERFRPVAGASPEGER